MALLSVFVTSVVCFGCLYRQRDVSPPPSPHVYGDSSHCAYLRTTRCSSVEKRLTGDLHKLTLYRCSGRGICLMAMQQLQDVTLSKATCLLSTCISFHSWTLPTPSTKTSPHALAHHSASRWMNSFPDLRDQLPHRIGKL